MPAMVRRWPSYQYIRIHVDCFNKCTITDSKHSFYISTVCYNYLFMSEACNEDCLKTLKKCWILVSIKSLNCIIILFLKEHSFIYPCTCTQHFMIYFKFGKERVKNGENLVAISVNWTPLKYIKTPRPPAPEL